MNKIGKYIITGELGRGAMGVVYSGLDPDIERKVAIKTIRFDAISQVSSQEQVRKRFLREAKAAGNLSHPNIVTIYDVGEEHGMNFIVMEYVEGSSLEEMIASGRKFSYQEIVMLIEQVGSALDYAHQKGVIHRDIKPANILIDKNFIPHIVDFGIARVTALAATQTNTVMGTPYYMSPEQIAGGDVDSRTDIFSLGTVLYELLTGSKPFEGDNITTVIYKIMNADPPPVRTVEKTLPPGLEYVVKKAMAKKVKSRYASCRELVTELNAPPQHRESIQQVSQTVPTHTGEIGIEKISPDRNKKKLIAVLAAMMGVLVIIMIALLTTMNKSTSTYSGGGGGGGGTTVSKIPSKTADEYGRLVWDAVKTENIPILEKYLNDGLRDYPNDPYLLCMQAYYYMEGSSFPNRIDLAEEALRKVLTIDQYYPLAFIFFRELAYGLGPMKEKEYQDMEDSRAAVRPGLYLDMADAAVEIDRRSEAFVYIIKFLRIDPENIRAEDARSTLMSLELQSRRDRNEILSNPPISQKEYEKKVAEIYNRSNKDYSLLNKTASEGLKYYPESSTLWRFYGIYFLESGFRSRSGSSEIDFELDRDLAVKAGNLALESDPLSSINSIFLGVVHEEMCKDLESALFYYLIGEDYGKQKPELYFRIAHVYRKLNQINLAVDYLNRFLQAAPNHQLAGEARKTLRDLTGR